MDNSNNNSQLYDLIIVGSGFAGYTAGIYASRYKMKNLLFGEVFGGQTSEAHIIGNYPGFEEIKGPELMNRVREQAKKLGTEEILERVVSLSRAEDNSYVTVTTKSGKTYDAKYVLLTIGMKRRKLNVPGELELAGKGITYCATCDGFFFRNKKVVVVGGGDAATTAALFLSNIASEVIMLVRGSRLKGEQIWVDQVLSHEKIKVHFNTKVESFVGDIKLEKVITSGDVSEVTADGVFIEIGAEPDAQFISALGLEADERGHINVDVTQATSQERIYAAGDVTSNSNHFEQLLTAGSEASIAVNAIFEKIQTS
ncbi:MAG: FAD-dependent oxidoreductase [Candidatus Dojkabacteria bacterium]|nr:MAG: FAD-dependent oxidoreductase [Candidatus Dojkabacteria bacterium]